MTLPTHLPLTGLVAAPSQVWGRIRLVPLLRPGCPADLRLGLQAAVPHLADVVTVPGGAYIAYVPHALVARWSEDGEPAAVESTTLAHGSRKPTFVIRHQRMRQRTDDRSVRMLPLHLAMNAFLERWIAGPEIVWPGWTRTARSRGFSPRTERSVPGRQLPDLAEALRLFEILADQVGVAVLVDDTLASVSVYAHPDDYRALHGALLEDCYSPIFQALGPGAGELPVLDAPLRGAPATVDDLRSLVAGHRSFLAEAAWSVTAPFWETPVEMELSYELGRFRLTHFLAPEGPAPFLGECILRPDGSLGYLRTYRLERDALRRFQLLRTFAREDWEPKRTAAALGLSLDELEQRMEGLGLRGAFEPSAVRGPGGA